MKKKKMIKAIGVILFGIYMILLIDLLFLSEGFGRNVQEGIYRYNIIPLYEIRRYLKYRKILGTRSVILNLAGNVIGFMPFGMLLPVFCGKARKSWKVTLLAMEISSVIEVTQLFLRVGSFDIDDILLNTLGGFLGYLVFSFCCKISRRFQRPIGKNGKNQQ